MKKQIAFLFFLISISAVRAQTGDNAHFGIHGNIGLPVGEFRETVNNSFGGTGWGGGLNLLINPKKGGIYSPVLIGFESNYMNLGTDKTPESVYLPQLKTSFNYFNVGPMIRAMLSNKEEGIIPFIDGFIGMKILNTKTKIDNDLVDTLLDQEYVESLLSTNYEGIGYGVGLGFFKRKLKSDAMQATGSFFMKITYQYGDRVNYVKRGSIEVDQEGFITYDTGRTQTSMVMVQAGFLIR